MQSPETRHRAALNVTTSAMPRTSAYVTNRNAPYFPAEASRMPGISAEKLDSSTASPSMPGIAISSIADVHSWDGTRRQRRTRRQIPAVRTGVSTKLIQYRIAVVSNTSGPRLSYQSVPAVQNNNPNPKSRATSRPRTGASSKEVEYVPAGTYSTCTMWYMKRQLCRRKNIENSIRSPKLVLPSLSPGEPSTSAWTN